MRKIKVLLLVLLIFKLQVLAVSIKDLEDRLAVVQGKDRIMVLIQLTQAYLRKDPQKALEYGEKSLELLGRFQDKEIEFGVLDQMCQAYLYLGDYSQAMEYGEKGLELARKIGSRKSEGLAFNIIGIIYDYKGDYSKSREYSSRAFDIFREIGEKRLMCTALNNIGISFDMQGNYEKALEYYLKSLRIKEEIGDKELIARSLNNIGVVLQVMGSSEEALKYYSRSLRIREEQGDRRGIALLYGNIGNVYKEMKDYSRALDYYQKSLEIDRELNNQSGVASTLYNIGSLYRQSEDYQQALDYLQRSLSLREQMGEKGSIAETLIETGKVYNRLGRYYEAVRNIEQGLAAAREIEALAPLRDGFQALSESYEALGNFRRALQYHKEYKNTADKILNSESQKKIAEIQARYEADKKEKEIMILKKNNQIQQLILIRQRFVRNLMIAGFIVVLLAGVYFIHKYRYVFVFWKKKNYIGHYRIIEQMGSGGMGTVYRASDVVDSTHKKTIAVKVLREEFFADEVQKKRFKQEATIIDQVNHPNIVRVIERGESEAGLYIAMEVLEGPTLAELILKEEKPDTPQSLKIMVQIADAIKSIHAMDIIHRDLKPDNIKLVEKDGDPYFVKLMDFGLAVTQHMTRLTETGLVVGSLSYLSPEQVSGGKITTATDIHAMGVIFYEMLTGLKPFIGETTIDIMKQILAREPIEITRFRPDLDRSLADLIMFMLKKDPALRPTADAVFALLESLHTYNSL
jgi:tetratricopeptide (TPR) repeat protein/tRNA A-37 threonylcarbamoyl transferase component Bud32